MLPMMMRNGDKLKEFYNYDIIGECASRLILRVHLTLAGRLALQTTRRASFVRTKTFYTLMPRATG